MGGTGWYTKAYHEHEVSCADHKSGRYQLVKHKLVNKKKVAEDAV